MGEELNRLIMYLVFTSRKGYHPLHVISFGSSGTGKSHLQEKVGELVPEEDRIEITALTENAFYYFDKGELGHKLVLIEDMDGAWSAYIHCENCKANSGSARRSLSKTAMAIQRRSI
ncbi:hypothetical protein MKQ70_37095 [Chitinophaga sedimenti]|uniref:hypothetical protein n=1 Tax=Chitinophaga sedimenti TaxID=2033606 RepID=UPI002003F877|nr:hypothetical protein [Chitinophaga sedimenti]MCK7560228.1 hypothetical protein [Chitinophaga sedimenti]